MGGHRGQRRSRIFVIDTHDIFRIGVRSVLENHPEVEVVGESASFHDGLQEIVETGADVALVGIREGERDSLSDLQPLREVRPEVGVMVLTRVDDDEALMAAMQVGARAYMTKDLTVEELTTALEDVAKGRNLMDHRRAIDAVRDSSRRRDEPDPFADLTRQERRILGLIAAGMTNRQIAERLFLVEKTVRNHVTRILAKLGVERRTQAALLAVRNGLSDDE